MDTCTLTEKSCKPCEGGVPPMTEDEIKGMLGEIDGWTFTGGQLQRAFDFKNYYETISFVNALAWVANKEGHHPILDVGFRQCTVKFWTHAIDGISENDFICAAKVNELIK